MQRRDGASGPEPGVHRDLVLVPFAEAAVVRQADVFLQLGDLMQHQTEEESALAVSFSRPRILFVFHKSVTHFSMFPICLLFAPLSPNFPVNKLMR